MLEAPPGVSELLDRLRGLQCYAQGSQLTGKIALTKLRMASYGREIRAPVTTASRQPHQQMNVVYDISLLGPPADWRGGLFRAGESLALALLESRECSLSFMAVEDSLHYPAVSYVKSSTSLHNVRLHHAALGFQLYSQLERLHQRVFASSGLAKIFWRGIRKPVRHSFAWAPRNLVGSRTLGQADVFHSPFFEVPSSVREYTRPKICMTVHDLIPVLFPHYFGVTSVEEHHFKPIVDSIRPSDWIFCDSQSTKNDLCNYRRDLDPSRVSVTYLGASEWCRPCRDTAKICQVRRKHRIADGPYILSLCTLEPRKNLAHLIRCFATLVEQEKLWDLKLVLVGNLGWEYDGILAEITNSAPAIRDRIVLTGRVEDDELSAIYSGSLAFVYPSLYEGFGLPPLEAMQCGVPVITSNTSSLPEVVGDAGIMVDPYDSDALSQAILSLYNQPELRRAMACKSLKRSQQFSWKRCASETIQGYQKAMNQ